jgi:glycosyltransferase involved in cell wall biosynthesis
MVSCVLVNAPFSGIEVHFRLLARELAASERIDRLDTIWLEHHPQERISRLPLVRSNWYAAAAWSTMVQIRNLRHRGATPDVALLNQVNPALFLNPINGMPPIVLHLDTTPLITSSMWEHYVGRPPRRPSIERLKRSVYARSFKVPRHLVAVSELVKRSLVDDYSASEDAVTVIPFSIDTEYWTRQPDQPTRDDASRIAFVGGEFRRKGGDMVLDAARRPEFSHCEFHIVTKEDIPDVPANVVVHRNVAPNTNQLRDLLAASSIFVLPTLADVSSIASLEAMAMEIPVITTPVGGIPEIVADGTTGYLVQPGDSVAFEDRLSQLVGSRALREQMGAAGRAKVEADHSVIRNVPRFIDLLER